MTPIVSVVFLSPASVLSLLQCLKFLVVQRSFIVSEVFRSSLLVL